jgi:hypothetical protein
MQRIISAIPIVEESVLAEGVVVGSTRRCPDGQRELHDGWLEDALLGEERNPSSVEPKALGEDRPGKHVAVKGHLGGKPLEGPRTDVRIVGAIEQCRSSSNARYVDRSG